MDFKKRLKKELKIVYTEMWNDVFFPFLKKFKNPIDCLIKIMIIIAFFKTSWNCDNVWIKMFFAIVAFTLFYRWYKYKEGIELWKLVKI